MTRKTERTEKLHWQRKHIIMPLILLFALVLSEMTPLNVTAKSATLKNEKNSHKIRESYNDEDASLDDEDTSSYTPIYTIADLAGINNNPEGKYILMNDIDMTEETKEGGSWDTGHGWIPLDSFSGTLDGNGHRIIGMHIYGTFSNDYESPEYTGYMYAYVGLFRSNFGTIKRLGLSNVDINTKTIGYAGSAGGITAYNNGNISECYVDGVIYNEGDYTGGIVGSMYNEGSIYNCYNAAKVSGNGIANSHTWNAITDTRYNYNIGEVDGYSIIDDGGIGNYALKGKNLNTDTENIRTKMLTEAQMRTKSMYVGFDFDNIWEIDPNSAYPYPQLKSNRHQRIEGFDIVTPPTKLIYKQGEKIDLSGGTAKIIYEGGYNTTVVLTNDMINNCDTTKVGEQDVFIEYGGQKASFKITVAGIDVTSIKIIGDGNSLTKGNSMQLKAAIQPKNATDSIIEWSSSNTEIATVDEKGKVDALQAGNVEITATSTNGISAKYSININVPCVLLKLNQTEISLYKGDTFELVPTLSPLDATETVSYKVSNSNIAKVDNNGKVTGYAAGKTKITASAGKVTTTCNVIVKRKMEDFHVEGVIDKKYTGDEIEQKIKVTDGSIVLDEDTDYEINYTDNIEVGTATIYVTGLGYYEGVIEKDFNISRLSASAYDTKLSTPEIKSVKSKSAKKLTVKWGKNEQSSGYQIRISTTKSFTKATTDVKKVDSRNENTKTIGKLKGGKKYFVQIRAYRLYDGEIYYSDWSVSKSAKVKK